MLNKFLACAVVGLSLASSGEPMIDHDDMVAERGFCYTVDGVNYYTYDTKCPSKRKVKKVQRRLLTRYQAPPAILAGREVTFTDSWISCGGVRAYGCADHKGQSTVMWRWGYKDAENIRRSGGDTLAHELAHQILWRTPADPGLLHTDAVLYYVMAAFDSDVPRLPPHYVEWLFAAEEKE